MGYYDVDGVWREGNPPPSRARPATRQMRPAEQRQNDRDPGVRAQARRQLRQGYYDVDGNWVAPAPANTEETLADLGPSFGAGLQRFVAGTVGTLRDLSDLGGAAAQFGARLGGADEATARRTAQLVGNVRDTALVALNPNVGAPLVAGMHGPTSEEANRTLFPDQHVPETTAGEYARTIGEFAPNALAPVRGGATALSRIAPVTRFTRAVAPAVASEGAGQLTEGTPAEGPARLLAALVGAGVSEGTVGLLTRQGLTPDERALRLIRRELADAGYSPEEITRVANRLLAQAPTEEVLGELMGPSGERLMRATAAMGRGAGRSAADQAFESRAHGRPGPATSQDPNRRGVTSIRDRVVGEAARAYAPQQTRAPNNYWDHLDALRTARQAQGAENYRNAYLQPIDQGLVQTHLAPLMEQAPDVARSGARQLEFEARRIMGQRSQLATAGSNDAEAFARLDAELADVRDAQRQLEAIANGERPNSLGTRAVDYFQRGLHQMEQSAGRGSPEAGAIASFRRGFNGLADQIAPALGDTRAQYGRSMAIEEYTDLGRRVFNMSEGELDRLLRGSSGRGLSVEEFDGFQLGVLDAIENKLGSGDTGFLARLARNANWRAALERAAGGPANARRFMDRLAREAAMQRTRNFVQTGSRTQPLQEDIRALTEGENELAFLNDGGPTGLIRSVGQAAKNPFDAAIRIVAWLYDRVHRPGIANPQVQEAMARRLFSRVTRESSKELRDALLALPGDRRTPEAIRNFVLAMTAGNSAAQSDDEPEPQSQEAVETPQSEGAETPPEAPSIQTTPDGKYQTADGRVFDSFQEAEAYAAYLRTRGGR